MVRILRSLHFLIFLYLSTITLAPAQNESFIYNGFHQVNLTLEGIAEIHSNGLLQLTNISEQQIGRAFYPFPITFNTTSSSSSPSLSFSTNFVFAIVPEENLGGHGIAFTISSSRDFTHALANEYLGLFNNSNSNLTGHNIFAIELDTVQDPEFEDQNENHVGIDVNGLQSVESAPAMYFLDEGKNISLELISGNPMHLWIDYDEAKKLLNVTLAPTPLPKPKRPLLSKLIDLSPIFSESMYIGFSSATGTLASDHYILGWSFNRSGPSKSLDISSLPPVPRESNGKGKSRVLMTILLIAAAVLLITITGVAYMLRKKKYGEIREEWEVDYGPHRFGYKDLHKATRGFNETEILGAGGFGKVYRGIISSSGEQIAVKRISHDSQQGMKEFVAEIVSMGRLRHRNLVQLRGYCRRKGEFLLVYDYMPNGSLDKFLYNDEKLDLNWFQRFRIIKGVACGLLYLHEEWEQVVLHRDVKASNVLLDAEFNARLGDFGLAKLYDHDSNPQTTHIVGTVGYLAPELATTGIATTSTDVYAFGAFMLEVACGRRPMERREPPEKTLLVNWVGECGRKGAILDACDPRLEGNFVAEEMELVLKVGLLCSHATPAARPSMRQVMHFLNQDAILLELEHDSTSFGTSASNPSSDSRSFPSSQASTFSISVSDSIIKTGR